MGKLDGKRIAKAVEELAEGRHDDMPQPSGTATA